MADHFNALRDWITQCMAIVIGEIEGFQPCPTIQVDLNEFMAGNFDFTEDPDEPGEYPDRIELHNPTGTPVDLSGIYLTDDATVPTNAHFSPPQSPLSTQREWLAAPSSLLEMLSRDPKTMGLARKQSVIGTSLRVAR